MINITLCICFYNSALYLTETLESLSAQSFRNFKLLLIDDGSVDETNQVIDSFFESHSMPHEVVKMPENRGTAYCREYALRHVDTPLMMFFDSDDIAEPAMIETLYRKIQSDDTLIAASCYCSYMDAGGNTLRGGLYLGPKTKEEFLEKAGHGKMIFMLPPTIFRREYAIRAGGYRQAEWFPAGPIRYQDLSEDVDLWGRMSDFFTEGKWMATVPTVLFKYRKNTNTLSAGFAKTRGMGQKLMYIKANQLRRRSGLSELHFEEFWKSLGIWTKFNFERRNLGACFYRRACFAWVNRSLLSCAWNLGLGTICSPLYPLEKYKANFRKNGK